MVERYRTSTTPSTVRSATRLLKPLKNERSISKPRQCTIAVKNAKELSNSVVCMASTYITKIITLCCTATVVIILSPRSKNSNLISRHRRVTFVANDAMTLSNSVILTAFARTMKLAILYGIAIFVTITQSLPTKVASTSRPHPSTLLVKPAKESSSSKIFPPSAYTTDITILAYTATVATSISRLSKNAKPTSRPRHAILMRKYSETITRFRALVCRVRPSRSLRRRERCGPMCIRIGWGDSRRLRCSRRARSMWMPLVVQAADGLSEPEKRSEYDRKFCV